MPAYIWALWAVFLFVQNYSFTYVSRARNSASLLRHAKASIFSNGIFWLNQVFAFSQISLMTGGQGIRKAIAAAFTYVICTLCGSLYAHHQSLHKESGKSAVGANAKYVQVTVQEWADLKARLHSIDRDIVGLGSEHGIITDAQCRYEQEGKLSDNIYAAEPIPMVRKAHA